MSNEDLVCRHLLHTTKSIESVCLNLKIEYTASLDKKIKRHLFQCDECKKWGYRRDIAEYSGRHNYCDNCAYLHSTFKMII